MLQTPTHMHPQKPEKKHELMTKKERWLKTDTQKCHTDTHTHTHTNTDTQSHTQTVVYAIQVRMSPIAQVRMIIKR